MRFSLTLILLPLMLLIASCSSIPEKKYTQHVLDIEIQTSKKNKEMIIERLLKEDVLFSLKFDDEDGYILDDNLLESNIYYFCDSFIEEQRQLIESKVFQETNKTNKVLVIYSDEYEAIALNLKKKYPSELYYLLSEKNYQNRVKEILEVNLSINNYSNISRLDKDIKIMHSPRIRNDISKIYFITGYDFGKTIVPTFRSYALKVDFYSSSEIFHEANSLKKLIDFEGTYVPISKNIIKKIENNKNVVTIKEKIEKLIIHDYLTIEKIYQNNLFKENINLETVSGNIQRNKCIKRNLPMWEISTSNFTDQS